MSKIALEGNVSGSGTLTIAAPNTNSNFTLSLPTNTGTIITQNSTPAFASTIGVGGATAAASGAGITFPATQSASSNANTLDDYEEGDWTPTIIGAGGSIGAQAYSIQAGRYVKIGRLVTLTGYVALTDKGSWTGQIRIGGFPFTVENTSAAYGGTSFYVSGMSYPAGGNGGGAYPVPNTTHAQLFYDSGTSGVSNADNYAGMVTNTSQVGAFTITYPSTN